MSRESQYEIVLARSQRERDRSLAGLLCAINENVGTRRLCADKDALGERFELKLLVLGFAALDLL